jgi:hypothetical protein
VVLVLIWLLHSFASPEGFHRSLGGQALGLEEDFHRSLGGQALGLEEDFHAQLDTGSLPTGFGTSRSDLESGIGYPHFTRRACGKECPSESGASGMCHEMAADNCRVPRWMLNDCWLNTYRECSNQCASPGVCDCHAEATAKCGSCDDPAIACYNTVHQQCMAGMGFAPDPDRGLPSGCTGSGCWE